MQGRYPESDALLERVADEPAAHLESYERHVLALVDGERSVLDICGESEIGDNETVKVLYALLCTGVLRVKGKKVHALDQDFVPVDSVYSVLDSFNQMYEHIFKYMVREVGPIAENVLEKYVGVPARGAQGRLRRPEAAEGRHPRRRGGGAEPQQVPRGAAARASWSTRLNELLYAELLAVKRTLGAEHEAAIIRALRDR